MLIIGVGNALRRDDGVGPYVASRLKTLLPDARTVHESGEGARLMELWDGADAVVLVDAVQSGAEPGTICRLDASREPVPGGMFHYSTHAFSVAEAVEMSRALGSLPGQMVVYGVEGENFGSGEGLTPKVAVAAEQVVRRILAEAGSADA